MIYPELNLYKDELLLEGEVWLPIKGYEGLYSVSNLGRVRREKWNTDRQDSIKVLKAHPAGKRYPKVVLCGAHKELDKSTLSVHRLVAEAFIPNPEGKPQVHHKNANVMDARAENLEWTTQSENIKFAFKEGRKVIKKGCESNLSKYGEGLVTAIYRDILKGGVPQRVIAKKWFVSQIYVSSLKTKKIWKDLTDKIDEEVTNE